MKEVSKAIGFMSILLVSCLSAVLFGGWLDHYFHSSPLILLFALAYAIIGNFYILWKELSKDE